MSTKKRINIYCYLILIIIIITFIILCESFPARVVCVPWCWRVFVGSRRLLKLSQPGRNWELCRRWSGIGGYVFGRITAVSGALYSVENIGISAVAILDNLYRKCYNKCNDDNKNVICHQTGKNAPVSRFYPLGYKITPNRQKRRTDDLHKIW